MFEGNWAYRIIVILSLCILLVWTYLTNEETLVNYISGKFILDTRLIWQVGIFSLLSIVLFYLMQSTLDYKAQNEVLKKYLQRLQNELEEERNALKHLRQESDTELVRLGSFIITISDMAKQISMVLETEELLRVLLKKTVELLGSRRCAIFKFDQKANKLAYIDSIGYKPSEISGLNLSIGDDAGSLGFATKTGSFLSRKQVLEDTTKKYIVDNDKIEVSFCQPIVYNSKTLAVICVGDAAPNLSHEQVSRLLSALSNFAAIALTNTELVDRIREQSRRDGLTWLYNHQYFQERLDLLLSNAISHSEDLGLIMLDVDYFKQFNDTYGHQAGDYILKNTADILTKESGKNALVARYGGEEFVIALPGTNASETFNIAENIRKRFESGIFEFHQTKLHITISAGVSAIDPTGTRQLKKNQLIKLADDALYKAKKEGRNRVIGQG